MFTSIKQIKLCQLPEEMQDDICLSKAGVYDLGDYIEWVVKYTETPNTFDSFCILSGAEIGETVLIHYVW